MLLVPAEFVTVTDTGPALPAGVFNVMVVPPEFTVKLELDTTVLPKFTAVAPVKFVPVIITEVPPNVEPLFGLIWLTVGTVLVPVPARFTC